MRLIQTKIMLNEKKEENTKVEQPIIKNDKKNLTDFHFPGNGEFQAANIQAESLDQAIVEWHKVRVAN